MQGPITDASNTRALFPAIMSCTLARIMLFAASRIDHALVIREDRRLRERALVEHDLALERGNGPLHVLHHHVGVDLRAVLLLHDLEHLRVLVERHRGIHGSFRVLIHRIDRLMELVGNARLVEGSDKAFRLIVLTEHLDRPGPFVRLREPYRSRSAPH